MYPEVLCKIQQPPGEGPPKLMHSVIYLNLLPKLSVCIGQVCPETSKQQRQTVSLESGRLGSLYVKVHCALGIRAVISARN